MLSLFLIAILLILVLFYRQVISLFAYLRYLFLPKFIRRAVINELYMRFDQKRFAYGYLKLIILQAFLSAHYDWLLKINASDYERTECSRQLVNVSIELEKHENL